MCNQNYLSSFQEQLQSCYQKRQTIKILGSGSKAFISPEIDTDQTIDVAQFSGVINYQPTCHKFNIPDRYLHLTFEPKR